MWAIYVHAGLLLVFGGSLVEAGVSMKSPLFWLLIIIVVGLILTIDIMYENQNRQENNEENSQDEKKEK